MPGPMSEITCNGSEECGASSEIIAPKQQKIIVSCKAFGDYSIHVWWSAAGEKLTNGSTYQIRKAGNLSEISFVLTASTMGEIQCHGEYFNNSSSANVSVMITGYDPISLSSFVLSKKQ